METEAEAEADADADVISLISLLPEGCISDIISWTSLKDVCRASAVSTLFRSASESDAVWVQFLPSNYQDIISRSVLPVVHSSKKELYYSLCNSPILIDGGRMSFALHKWSGKKCFMLSARELSIAWKDTPIYWKWTSLPESRFSEVAELVAVCWLDIGGKMPAQMLSPNTNYGVYLVYRLSKNANGLEFPFQASVRICADTRDGAQDDELSYVYLYKRPRRRLGSRGLFRFLAGRPQIPLNRADGWMEVQLGVFFNDGEIEGEIETRLMETKVLNWKCGLIIEGIELRPKEQQYAN